MPILYKGSAGPIPTSYGPLMTPAPETTLTVAGGKLTYTLKATFVETTKSAPTFLLEVEVKDVPLK